jgi:hypothetical protein
MITKAKLSIHFCVLRLKPNGILWLSYTLAILQSNTNDNLFHHPYSVKVFKWQPKHCETQVHASVDRCLQTHFKWVVRIENSWSSWSSMCKHAHTCTHTCACMHAHTHTHTHTHTLQSSSKNRWEQKRATYTVFTTLRINCLLRYSVRLP